MSLRFPCDTSTLRRRMKPVNAMPAVFTATRPGRGQPFADVVAENLDAVYRYLVYLTGDRAAAEAADDEKPHIRLLPLS